MLSFFSLFGAQDDNEALGSLEVCNANGTDDCSGVDDMLNAAAMSDVLSTLVQGARCVVGKNQNCNHSNGSTSRHDTHL